MNYKQIAQELYEQYKPIKRNDLFTKDECGNGGPLAEELYKYGEDDRSKIRVEIHQLKARDR